MIDSVLAAILSVNPLLVLVSDPDGLLADEEALLSLTERGYLIINEPDPVALRYQYQQVQLSGAGKSSVVVTAGQLTHLPYDLWQQGYHITLALHELFPNLDYPTLRQLSPGQRWRLAEAVKRSSQPARPLSPKQTRDFLLRVVFDVVAGELRRPAALLLWLSGYHSQADPMPPALAAHLLAQLQQVPAFAGWPLAELLADPEAYRRFVQEAWDGFVGQYIGEARPTYEVLPFADDVELQDALPRLVRTGALTPLVVERSAALPDWAQPAVALDDQSARLRQFSEGLEDLRSQLEQDDLRWERWQTIARRWAQLTLWRYDFDLRLPADPRDTYDALQADLDRRFAGWLHTRYMPLANQRLPTPHHLYHVLHFLVYKGAAGQRVTLLVLDGMALSDWLLIRATWQARHADWRMDEHLVLAQIPCITVVSRQALVSGRRPALFADSLPHLRHEARHWSAFWQSQGLPVSAITFEALPNRLNALPPAAIDSRRTQALCLISPVIDQMLHGATQGAGDVQASLRLWLQDGSHWLEGLIDRLLDNGYRVVLTSDHGHVEAVGMGQPQEGVTVETRSKRARLYNNAAFARTVQQQYPDTILWQDDSLLPAGWLALMPEGRKAFAPQNQRVVSHGGLTIDEMVVPLVTLTRS